MTPQLLTVIQFGLLGFIACVLLVKATDVVLTTRQRIMDGTHAERRRRHDPR